MAVRIALFVLFVATQADNNVPKKYDWKCTDQYCQDVDCPKLPADCQNSSKALLVPSIETCNCCDHCYLFQKEGEDCIKLTTDFTLPPFVCGPKLTCNDSRKCEPSKSMPAMKTDDRHFFENYVCENKKCHCYVINERGEREKIFGEFSESSLDKNKTQCGCSVVAYKAKNQILRALPFKNVNQPSARCLKNGQFDPLQCIGDMCGCVEQETGIPDGNGFRFSLIALGENHPSCFNPRRHIPGYFTNCEKERNTLLQEINEGFWYNNTVIHFKRINCNPDGTYAE